MKKSLKTLITLLLAAALLTLPALAAETGAATKDNWQRATALDGLTLSFGGQSPYTLEVIDTLSGFSPASDMGIILGDPVTTTDTAPGTKQSLPLASVLSNNSTAPELETIQTDQTEDGTPPQLIANVGAANSEDNSDIVFIISAIEEIFDSESYTVTSIEPLAFNSLDNIESIQIGSNILDISDEIFSGTPSLTTIVVNGNTGFSAISSISDKLNTADETVSIGEERRRSFIQMGYVALINTNTEYLDKDKEALEKKRAVAKPTTEKNLLNTGADSIALTNNTFFINSNTTGLIATDNAKVQVSSVTKSGKVIGKKNGVAIITVQVTLSNGTKRSYKMTVTAK